jgi:hypothetical protein
MAETGVCDAPKVLGKIIEKFHQVGKILFG